MLVSLCRDLTWFGGWSRLGAALRAGYVLMPVGLVPPTPCYWVGWGAVQVGGRFGNQILGAVRGTLNHPLQEVGMGGIFVVAELLRFCVPPITVVTDCQNLVDGFYTLGPGGTASSGCRYADVWRQFWLAVSDFGRDLVTVVKVPSHRSLEAFMALPGARVADWHGNQQADLAAKRGAAMHGEFGDSKRKAHAADLLVETIARYVGRLHVHLTDGKLVDCQQRGEVSGEIEPVRRVAEAVPPPPLLY